MRENYKVLQSKASIYLAAPFPLQFFLLLSVTSKSAEVDS